MCAYSMCADSCTHAHPYFIFPMQRWRGSHAVHHGPACASIFVRLCPIHTKVKEIQIEKMNPHTTSFGTHQFVTCEKRQSEDCK